MDAGSSNTIHLNWTVPDSPVVGSYGATVAVWIKKFETPIGFLHGRLDLEEENGLFLVGDELPKFLAVPYYYQGDTSWCALASTAMILKYYGKSIHPEKIAEIYGISHDRNPFDEFLEGKFLHNIPKEMFEKQGLTIHENIKFELEYIKSSLNKGYPIFLGLGEPIHHAAVIVGYKETNFPNDPIIFITDPSGYLTKEICGKKKDPAIAVPIQYSQLKREVVNPVWFLGWRKIYSVQGTPDTSAGTVFVLDRSIIVRKPNLEDVCSLWLDNGYSWNYTTYSKSGPRKRSLTVKPNYVFVVDCWVCNHLSENKEYNVKFCIREPSTNSVYSGTFEDLDGGSFDVPERSMEYASLPSLIRLNELKAGDYTIEIVLEDESGKYCDRIGPIPFKVESANQPDLRITKFDIQPNPCHLSDDVTVTFGVKNQGNADAGRHTEAFLTYSEHLSQRFFTCEGLKPGETKTFSFTKKNIQGPTGSFEFKVKADVHEEIPESNDDNNIKAVNLEIKPKEKDTTPPETKCILSPSSPNGECGWYVTPVTVTLESTDDSSGIEWINYSIDSGSWQIYSGSEVSFTVSNDGVHYITYYAKDKAGNEEKQKISDFFYIDKTKPSASLSINNGAEYTNSGSVTLYLSYSDATSGVRDCGYKNEGDWWGSWESCSSTKSWTLAAGEGTKKVYYQVRDNAGNIKEVYDTIILQQPQPKLCTSPDPPSHNFGTVPKDQTRSWNFEIKNCGSGTLTWSVSGDKTWITVNPTSGSTTTETDTVTVTISTYGLSPGTYTGHITVTSNGGSKTGTITAEVPTPPPQPKLCTSPDPPSHDFGIVSKEKGTSWSFGIRNCGSGTLTWSVSDDKPWMTVYPTSGSTTTETDTVTVTISTYELSQGTYTGHITISSNDGGKTGTIKMKVPTPPPQPKLCTSPDPPSHDFGIVSKEKGTSWSFGIRNCGSGTLTWSISDDKPWMTVYPTSGSTTTETDTVTVTIDMECYLGLSPGTHTGHVTISSNGGSKTGTITVLRENQPPTNPTLTPDKSSSQPAGTTIKWTASATDPDGDRLYYRFWLRGPAAGNSWQIKRDWSTANTWTWHTTSSDVGDNDISVWIRDGHHASTGSSDLEKIVNYEITPEKKPDLIVSSINLDPNPAHVGDNVGIFVTVKNQGKGDAGSHFIRVSDVDSGFTILEWPCSELKAGTSKTFNYYFLEVQRTTSYKVCADSYNIIEESNEDNNCLTAHLTVQSVSELNYKLDEYGVIQQDYNDDSGINRAAPPATDAMVLAPYIDLIPYGSVSSKVKVEIGITDGQVTEYDPTGNAILASGRSKLTWSNQDVTTGYHAELFYEANFRHTREVEAKIIPDQLKAEVRNICSYPLYNIIVLYPDPELGYWHYGTLDYLGAGAKRTISLSNKQSSESIVSSLNTYLASALNNFGLDATQHRNDWISEWLNYWLGMSYGSTHQPRVIYRIPQNLYKQYFTCSASPEPSKGMVRVGLVELFNVPTPTPSPSCCPSISISTGQDTYMPGDNVYVSITLTGRSGCTFGLNSPSIVSLIAPTGETVTQTDMAQGITSSIAPGGHHTIGRSMKLPLNAPLGRYDVKVSLSGGKCTKTANGLFLVVTA